MKFQLKNPATQTEKTFTSQGVLIGSHALNDWVLIDDPTLAPFCVAIRPQAQQGYEVICLSTQTPVQVNQQNLAFKQRAHWTPVCTLQIGDWHIRQLPEETPQQTAIPNVPSPVISDTPEQAAPTGSTLTPPVLDDPFADLLNSPGVVPVGAMDLDSTHPFDAERATQRNSANPLEQLQSNQLNAPHDPLSGLLK